MTALGDLVQHSDPAMTVVTTTAGGTRAGCLVGFHSQSGMDPDVYAVWLSKANHTYDVATRADRFAVHFLASDQRDLARRFGTTCGATTDKFADLEWASDAGGVPLLDACPGRLVGTRQAFVDTGSDHVCLVLDVVEVALADNGFTPLRLSDVVDLVPAHEGGDGPGADPEAVQ